MTIKVSVIVPVYNPGRYLEDCIRSLLRQSMPVGQFEAIFVDDGSTDETPVRLDALAAEHPQMRVIHQANSGWSGGPRNVGIEAAHGEYVFFADHDDWLGDEALERLHEFATRNDADVVIGKMAGRGRGVPRELFRRSYDDATLEDVPLIDSLTPHKLFRKAFLDVHGLRFPEGRRRLEDHVFVTEAFFLAKRVSVLSDYVCYYHVRRDDSSNAGFQRIDPKGYFANLREALDIVEKYTQPGWLRDKLFRRWLRVEMVERLRGARFHRQPEDYREHLFREIRAVVQERFGPGVWTSMAPMQRVVVELLLADRLDDVVALAQWEAGVGSRAHLTDLRWQDGSLGLALTAELAVRGQPVTFRRHGEQALLEPPLSPQARALIPPEHLETTTHLRKTKVDVVLRSRQSGAEHYVPATFDLGEQELGPDPGVFSVQLHAEARIDPSNVAGGSPLTSGVWEVLARVNSCGWSKESRVGSVRFPEISRPVYPAMVDGDPLAVTPHLDGQGHLSLDIASAPPSRGRKEVRRSPWRARFRPRSEHRLLR